MEWFLPDPLLLEHSRDILLASANKLKIALPEGKRRQRCSNEFALAEWCYNTYNSPRAEALIAREVKYILHVFFVSR